MSEVKVNKISPRTNCGTVQLGDSGDTITIPAGATITNNGTQTGFGRTGTVDWDTTPKTASFNATSGDGFFCNTTSSAFTATLPTGSAGAIVSFADYAATWQTNNLTVAPQSGEKIGGVSASVVLNTEGQSVTFIYVDSTQGWINTMDSTSNVRANEFIVATGGTVTTSGDYKIHTFTGPGTFCVSDGGAPSGSNTVDYLVVAGGGGSGSSHWGGGGGGGGFRISGGTTTGCYTVSPLGSSPTSVAALPVTAQGYPITVGGGGATNPSPGVASNGGNSIFSTITSAGGGGGGGYGTDGADGGSGGGGGGCAGGCAGSGNTPPVSPPQGQNGGPGNSSLPEGAGGGGGAGAVGTTAGPPGGGPGGVGSYSNINPSTGTTGPVCGARYYSGGGGGNQYPAYPGSPGSGGSGGGGSSANGTANTGGGAGSCSATGKTGGSGIVIIRYKFQ